MSTTTHHNTPLFASFRSPILAVDLGSSNMRALLYVPGLSAHEQYGFMLPSPERLLAERIRANTALGRAIHIWGLGLGRNAAHALAEHRDSRFGTSMHPETATLLSDNPVLLEQLGVVVSKTAPPMSVSIKANDYDPEYWHSLFSITGLPQPKVVLIAALESDKLWLPESMEERARLVQDFFHAGDEDGVSPADLMSAYPAEKQLRLAAIARITGHPVTDSVAAFIMGLAAYPEIAERAQRQGVVLLHLGRRYMCAALYFRKKIVSWLELPYADGLNDEAGRVTQEALLACLENFSLGWLPREKALAMGGFMYKIPELPAEAEGFKPIYVTGHQASLLKGSARLLNGSYGSAMHRCWGLLYGYAAMCGQPYP